MTVQEFKQEHPEYAHLEGDELWNLMAEYKLQQQQGESILRQIEPFWNRYKLRYLFYKSGNNWNFSRNNYSASKRCKACKKGVSMRIGILYLGKFVSYCPHCGKEYHEEPNTNLNRKLFLVGKKLEGWFWRSLELLHILKIGSRYDMFGDEAHYVKHWKYNLDSGKSDYELKPRSWWEYIIIKK